MRWFSSPGNDNQPVAFFMPSAIQLSIHRIFLYIFLNFFLLNLDAFSLTQSDVIDVHILGIQQKVFNFIYLFIYNN